MAAEFANVKCPFCGASNKTPIPKNSCLASLECNSCGKTITPKNGSCCVICSYSEKRCGAHI